MADSVAYQHTDGNRNYDGSNLVYGVIEKERGSFHTASFLLLQSRNLLGGQLAVS